MNMQSADGGRQKMETSPCMP